MIAIGGAFEAGEAVFERGGRVGAGGLVGVGRRGVGLFAGAPAVGVLAGFGGASGAGVEEPAGEEGAWMVCLGISG